jgi:hypothetical protein
MFDSFIFLAPLHQHRISLSKPSPPMAIPAAWVAAVIRLKPNKVYAMGVNGRQTSPPPFPSILFSGLPAATSLNIRRKRKRKEWVKDRDWDVDMSGGEEDLRGRSSLHKGFLFYVSLSKMSN